MDKTAIQELIKYPGLEDSRRQLSNAQINTITAKRDRAVAWITLHRVLGASTNLQGKGHGRI